MNTDKAYLLGLIIGGGKFGCDGTTLHIRLPFKKWGSYIINPRRAGAISRDIFQKVGPMFQAIYQLNIQYEATDSLWTILCDGDISDIVKDLQGYGIKCAGELRGHTDITQIVGDLVDDNLKRRFVAGLADTIGSMARAHRRFDDDHQTLSFEIKGFDFKFVCNLCKLLYSINCIPDQIAWNHPNIHSPQDPYYTDWHKGFKLRILLDQYAHFGAFAFRTKIETLNENRIGQRSTHKANACETCKIKVKPKTVHPAEADARLPRVIRNGHYIHFRHFCAVLGCEHAPYCELEKHFDDIGKYVLPFPSLSKDSYLSIKQHIDDSPLLKNRSYSNRTLPIASLLEQYHTNHYKLVFGKNAHTGYPINFIMQAIAYVVASNEEIVAHGKRVKGKYIKIIENHLSLNPLLKVEIRIPDLLTPLIIVGNDRAALVAATNPEAYKKIVSRDSNNKYKLLVREITESDLRA